MWLRKYRIWPSGSRCDQQGAAEGGFLIFAYCWQSWQSYGIMVYSGPNLFFMRILSSTTTYFKVIKKYKKSLKLERFDVSVFLEGKYVFFTIIVDLSQKYTQTDNIFEICSNFGQIPFFCFELF